MPAAVKPARRGGNTYCRLKSDDLTAFGCPDDIAIAPHTHRRRPSDQNFSFSNSKAARRRYNRRSPGNADPSPVSPAGNVQRLSIPPPPSESATAGDLFNHHRFLRSGFPTSLRALRQAHAGRYGFVEQVFHRQTDATKQSAAGKSKLKI